MCVLKFSLLLQFVKLVECQATLSPYGINMCRDFCKHQGNCLSVMFSMDKLTCRLLRRSGRLSEDVFFHQMILPKYCKRPEDRSLLSKRNIHVCVKVQIDRAVYVAGGKPHCQYDLKTGSWSRINQTEVPKIVRYAEESGYLYQVFQNHNRGSVQRIERTSLTDPNLRTTLFKQNSSDGLIFELAVDGVNNVVFFTVQKRRMQSFIMYRKVSEKPVETVDLGKVSMICMLTVDTIKGTLYCTILRLQSEAVKKLTEITYNGSVVTTYKLPQCVRPILAFDKYEKSLYTFCDGDEMGSTALYILTLGSSREFRETVVLGMFQSLVLASNNFIYVLGKGGLIFSKDMKLVENITGGCHDMPNSGYVLQ